MCSEEREFMKNLISNLSPEMKELAKTPTITDYWGFQYNWTNTDEGWYPFRKYLFLEVLKKIKIQRETVKKFTEFGYKVMPIPPFLFETILDQKEEKSIQVEKCMLSRGCFMCVSADISK